MSECDCLLRRVSRARFRARSSGSGPEAGLIASSGIVVAGRLETEISHEHNLDEYLGISKGKQ